MMRDVHKNVRNLSMSSAKATLDPTLPYNELPLLPPPAQRLETHAVLKTCITAARALARLQQAAALIPNQDVLINSIPLREAKDSSAIENIVTTNDKLFRFANIDPAQADEATKETLRYRTALFAGFNDLKQRPLTTRTAVMVCRVIKNTELDIRRLPGTVLRNPVTGETLYTPPEGEALLRDKMSNWEKFIHNFEEIDPLVRMAVGHYQFEAIHPFPDGNGRTGRIINILFLVDKGLLDLPILYLSRYINENRAEYYRLLHDVTLTGAWEPWILYMLNAVENTSNWTREKILSTKSLMTETVRYVSTSLPKIYSRELVEVLFTQPYCRISDVIRLNIASRNTATKYLKELSLIGVLEQKKEGRELFFVNKKFLQLLMDDANEFRPYGTIQGP